MTVATPGPPRPRGADDLAIVLPGGGARAAYQVGFLRWVAKHIPDAHFPIVTGVSAGAINATFLASYRGTQTAAVDRLCDIWSHCARRWPTFSTRTTVQSGAEPRTLPNDASGHWLS